MLEGVSVQKATKSILEQKKQKTKKPKRDQQSTKEKECFVECRKDGQLAPHKGLWQENTTK